MGTANSATDHHVYIWDMHGHLIKILGQGEKIKDGALWFACHPTRPILAACARSGAIYIWTKRYSENWSAFAPDFKELEENEVRCRPIGADLPTVPAAALVSLPFSFSSAATFP